MSEQLHLENQLCFRLYKLNKNLTKLYAPLLKEIGLTYPQYLVMLVLWKDSTAKLVKEIGRELELDTGTLSPLLKRMEKLDLVKRTRSELDERAVFIALTSHGKHIKAKAKLIPAKLFTLTALSKNELIALKTSLDELLDNTAKHLT
ncbi:MarR family winged helix-turn-helix transcriptional regulator [Thalassotalea piscium]|uniref:DNA-binding MarR family transcriptional regulator n=1 Tax=Thalassotalea piscium TaxID=1230533 RepID=A0A7X0NEZ2_9GAMM|nr:MarR family transcriptional regulator [Thalassotalea piscium]MBB6542165.1 DNA-binding MarR family transcriptional regulator [Thalassotalea piscium]